MLSVSERETYSIFFCAGRVCWKGGGRGGSGVVVEIHTVVSVLYWRVGGGGGISVLSRDTLGFVLFWRGGQGGELGDVSRAASARHM